MRERQPAGERPDRSGRESSVLGRTDDRAEHEADAMVERTTGPLIAPSLAAGSRSIDPGFRAAMEAATGHRFGSVRVHYGGAVDAVARSIGAIAYTRGRDVHISSEHWRSGTAQSGRTLAHELAHVAQAGQGGGDVVRRQPVDPTSQQSLSPGFVTALSDAALEHQAEVTLEAYNRSAAGSVEREAQALNLELVEGELRRRGQASPALARDALYKVILDIATSLREMTKALRGLATGRAVGNFKGLFGPYVEHGVDQALWITNALDQAGRRAQPVPGVDRATALNAVVGAAVEVEAAAFASQLLATWIAYLEVVDIVVRDRLPYSVEHLYKVVHDLWNRVSKPFGELASLSRPRVEAAAVALPELLEQLATEHEALVDGIDKAVRLVMKLQVIAGLVEMVATVSALKAMIPRGPIGAGPSIRLVSLARAGGGGSVAVGVVVSGDWAEAIRRLIQAGAISSTVVAAGVRAGIGTQLAMSSTSGIGGPPGSGGGGPGSGGGGPYSHLEGTDRTEIRAGRDFTQTQKKKIIQANKDRNGGRIKSDDPDDPFQDLSPPEKSVSRGMGGTGQDPAMASVDHIDPQSGGGTNAYGNARVISQYWNNLLRAKGVVPKK